MNYPELASAQVNVYLPNQVQVTVTERQPVIMWQKDGGITWIDSTGVAFRPRGLVTGLVMVNGLGMPPVVRCSSRGAVWTEAICSKGIGGGDPRSCAECAC